MLLHLHRHSIVAFISIGSVSHRLLNLPHHVLRQLLGLRYQRGPIAIYKRDILESGNFLLHAVLFLVKLDFGALNRDLHFRKVVLVDLISRENKLGALRLNILP